MPEAQDQLLTESASSLEMAELFVGEIPARRVLECDVRVCPCGCEALPESLRERPGFVPLRARTIHDAPVTPLYSDEARCVSELARAHRSCLHMNSWPDLVLTRSSDFPAR